MTFIFETLRYSFCAGIRNVLKIVTFCHLKNETGVFQFVLDASPPPRPKMPFGQLNFAIQIYYICKGRLGSRVGKGLYKRKNTPNI